MNISYSRHYPTDWELILISPFLHIIYFFTCVKNFFTYYFIYLPPIQPWVFHQLLTTFLKIIKGIRFLTISFLRMALLEASNLLQSGLFALQPCFVIVCGRFLYLSLLLNFLFPVIFLFFFYFSDFIILMDHTLQQISNKGTRQANKPKKKNYMS